MKNTKIQWCDDTLNPVSGCTKVSPGCKHCYAEALSNRQLWTPGRGGAIGKWGPGAPRKFHPNALKEAHRLNRKPWVCGECMRAFDAQAVMHGQNLECHGKLHRRQIFSASLADWLDPEIPVEYLARWLDTIRQCDQVTWLLLTKRIERWKERLTAIIGSNHEVGYGKPLYDWLREWLEGNPPQHIKLGVSVENQECADLRIPELLLIPASGRFLSIEPLLGPVDLDSQPIRDAAALRGDRLSDVLDWVIIGGESGPNARPCNVEWTWSLKNQCAKAGVPAFVKQLGAYVVDRNDVGYEGDSGPRGWPMDTHAEDSVEFGEWQGKPVRVVLNDHKGGDPAEWPEDIRVRQWPKWRAV